MSKEIEELKGILVKFCGGNPVNWDNLVEDFKNLTGKDPDINEGLLAAFVTGVLNTMDAKSKFNKNYDGREQCSAKDARPQSKLKQEPTI